MHFRSCSCCSCETQVRPDQSADHVLNAIALLASCAPASEPVQQALCSRDILSLLLPLVFQARRHGTVGALVPSTPLPNFSALSLRLGATRLLRMLATSSTEAVNEVGAAGSL